MMEKALVAITATLPGDMATNGYIIAYTRNGWLERAVERQGNVASEVGLLPIRSDRIDFPTFGLWVWEGRQILTAPQGNWRTLTWQEWEKVQDGTPPF
jgi:hypothetical protein